MKGDFREWVGVTVLHSSAVPILGAVVHDHRCASSRHSARERVLFDFAAWGSGREECSVEQPALRGTRCFLAAADC